MGTVSIDANGDRNADYSLLDLNPETDMFEVSEFATVWTNQSIYFVSKQLLETINWCTLQFERKIEMLYEFNATFQ